jgi:hypothetical protein
MRIIKILAVIAFSAAMFMSCGGPGASSSPSDVVEAFYSALESNNADNMLQCMENPDDKDSKMAVSMLPAMLEGIGGMSKIAVTKEEISEDGMKAIVYTTLELKNGDKKEGETELVKTDNGWKISDLVH